jgi:hypothetical protein
MRRVPLSPAALLAVSAVALAGCPAPTTGLAQAQQTAQEFNLNARFGRNEMITEEIAPAARDEYALHHKLWGTEIRVADIEIAGMKSHGDKDVDVVVRVAWYLPEQQELRSTTLSQSWHAKGTGWELVSEKRAEGDMGLLGEAVVIEAPAQPRAPVQFPTVRLGGGDPVQD